MAVSNNTLSELSKGIFIVFCFGYIIFLLSMIIRKFKLNIKNFLLKVQERTPRIKTDIKPLINSNCLTKLRLKPTSLTERG